MISNAKTSGSESATIEPFFDQKVAQEMPNVSLIGGGGEKPVLSVGRVQLAMSMNPKVLVEKIRNHPKNPAKRPIDKQKLNKAISLAMGLPFKPRKSGEPYVAHLLRSALYYLNFCPNPTVDGLMAVIHHDSYEEHPEGVNRIRGAIGVTSLETVMALSKMPPKLLEETDRKGISPRVMGVHKRVRSALESHSMVLDALNFEATAFKLARNSLEMLPFLRELVTPEVFLRELAATEGSLVGSRSHNPDDLIALGELYQRLRMGSDNEDLYEEMALAIGLLETEESDMERLYIKISGDRIDNIIDITSLRTIVNRAKTDSSVLAKAKKALGSATKTLVTTKFYLHLVKTRLKNPELYAVLSTLVGWYENEIFSLELSLR